MGFYQQIHTCKNKIYAYYFFKVFMHTLGCLDLISTVINVPSYLFFIFVINQYPYQLLFTIDLIVIKTFEAK